MADHPMIGEKILTRLTQFLTRNQIPFKQDELLQNYTTFRLGGNCPCIVFCDGVQGVTKVIRHLVENKINYILIGEGSNLLVSDDGIPKVVICYSTKNSQILKSNETIVVSGSTNLDSLVKFTVSQGIDDFVNCSGIPGTVGGAIAGNAGAFGWEISQSLTSIKVIGKNGIIETLRPENGGFIYRNSAIRVQEKTVLEVSFHTRTTSKECLIDRRKSILELRASKHPDIKKVACAGSFFRNIKPSSAASRRQAAGWFLEQSGSKSMSIGGAAVFAKHANIIIKKNATCTAQNVFDLSLRMADAVRDRFGINLEREVQVLGNFEQIQTSYCK